MTVETPDPETERENLAQKVFLLEKWQAEAVKIISKLEGECDEARAERDELKTSLEAAEASIDALRDSLHARETELTQIKGEREIYKDEASRLYKRTSEQHTQLLDAQTAMAKHDAECTALAEERDDFQRRFDQCREMFRASLDAI
jgi:chromosome segregation ATPase